MIKATCTEIIKDNKGKITGYILKEKDKALAKSYKFDVKTLKNHILNNNLEIDNLELVNNDIVYINTEDAKMNSFINRATIMGYDVTEIKMDDIHKCYLASRDNNREHILKIPNNIINFNGDYLKNIRGNLRVLGGKGLVNVQYMFMNTYLDTLDLSGLETSNIEQMGYMFYRSRIAELLLRDDFFGHNLKDIKYMFRSARIVNVDFSNLSISHLKNIDHMLDGLWSDEIKLFSLDGIESAEGLLEYSGFKTLDLRHWNITSLKNHKYIFKNCEISGEVLLSDTDRKNRALVKNKACWSKEERLRHDLRLKQSYLERTGQI